MNRVAMITGAAKNTGLAIARYFAGKGYDVVITSRCPEEAEQAAAALGRETPAVRVLGLGLDQGRLDSIRACFSQVKEKMGVLHAFVANAAHLGVGFSIFNTRESDWDAVLNANAKGTFFCCQEAIQLMAEGSAICLISSVHAKCCIPERILYTTSKGAINAMMRALAIELAHLGIRANAVIAGAIHTDRWDAQTPAETAHRRLKYPSGREAMPEEIAAGVYYLCSEEAATVTGTELTIDSGILDCLLPYEREWRQS